MSIKIKPFRTKLNEVILKVASSELGEDGERRQEAIEIIRQWMAKQPHLQHILLGNSPMCTHYIVTYLNIID